MDMQIPMIDHRAELQVSKWEESGKAARKCQQA